MQPICSETIRNVYVLRNRNCHFSLICGKIANSITLTLRLPTTNIDVCLTKIRHEQVVTFM